MAIVVLQFLAFHLNSFYVFCQMCATYIALSISHCYLLAGILILISEVVSE